MQSSASSSRQSVIPQKITNIPVTMLRNSAVNAERERGRVQYLNSLKNSNDIQLRYLQQLLLASPEKNTILDTLIKATNFRIN